MNWITNFVRPKIRAVWPKRDTPDDLWTKCPACGQMIFQKDLVAAQYVCPHCDHHLKIGTKDRFDATFDGAWEEITIPAVPVDPLKFRDEKRYTDRLKEARSKTGQDDSVRVATGTLDRVPLVVAVQSFAFMGGSLGMAAGEAVVTACEAAIKRRAPLVMYTGTGGDFILDANAADHSCGSNAARCRLAVHCGLDRSNDRRGHGVLCDAGRYSYC
jgi:acetyl-CoA carboxylase carboxyl transferase subunit beta